MSYCKQHISADYKKKITKNSLGPSHHALLYKSLLDVHLYSSHIRQNHMYVRIFFSFQRIIHLHLSPAFMTSGPLILQP